MMKPKPAKTLLALFAVVVAAQLLNAALQQLRPPQPPTFLSGAARLADPRAPSLGQANADVVIVLFSDYACPVCRAMHSDLRRLVEADAGVRIVYRDWPILGPRSKRAAELAIASARQGRHGAFDDAMMRRGGTLDADALRAAAQRAGVDWTRLERDASQNARETSELLDETDRLARGLGFTGTPTLVIGSYLAVGRISAERLAQLVALNRSRE